MIRNIIGVGQIAELCDSISAQELKYLSQFEKKKLENIDYEKKRQLVDKIFSDKKDLLNLH